MPLDSARQILGVIAGSIIGVGGVALSVTMVALTLTSGQYGPKILRNFLEDGLGKVTLGLFLGTYVYTLIVLTGYAQARSPQFTVLVSLLLALFALFAFVGFIHRTATDLQAEKIPPDRETTGACAARAGSTRLIAGHQRPRHGHHLYRLVEPWSDPDGRSGLARLCLSGS